LPQFTEEDAELAAGLKRMQDEIVPHATRIEQWIESWTQSHKARLTEESPASEKIDLLFQAALDSEDIFIANELFERCLTIARDAAMGDIEAAVAVRKAAVATALHLPGEFQHYAAVVRRLTSDSSLLRQLEQLETTFTENPNVDASQDVADSMGLPIASTCRSFI